MNERIREIRESAGLTQQAFAERIGVTKATVSRWESSARSVTRQQARTICTEFNVSAEWLENGAGDMEQRSDVDDALTETACAIFDRFCDRDKLAVIRVLERFNATGVLSGKKTVIVENL